jgi:hypothetical protein
MLEAHAATVNFLVQGPIENKILPGSVPRDARRRATCWCLFIGVCSLRSAKLDKQIAHDFASCAWEIAMNLRRPITFLALSVALACGAWQTRAQSEPVANPVSASVKSQLGRFTKNIVGGAEAMPADKYGFKPTPEMMSFGHLMVHIAQSNNMLCAKLSGMAAPEGKLEETDGKDKLVAGLKASFDFCSTALANADDAKLGEQIPLFGDRLMPRAAAWIALASGWNDHYSAEAIYLRLNGILPPSAQPKK